MKHFRLSTIVIPAIVALLLVGLIYLDHQTAGSSTGEPEERPADIEMLDAQIIHHTTPERVRHDGVYSIDITVQNTGSKVWSERDLIRLCIWQDGVDWGYRLLLPEGVSVAPGETSLFRLEGFVLPEAEQTTLEFQMLQEGVLYFGEREAVTITAID